MRTIEWMNDLMQVKLIDQRKLPGVFECITCADVDELVYAIQDMAIRGAPALGVAGAFGLALSAFRSSRLPENEQIAQLKLDAEKLIAARPTAINLRWGVTRILNSIVQKHDSSLSEFILHIAQEMADEDIAINKRLAKNGATLIEDGDTIIHHCNTGSLAVVEWGTALGAIRFAHESGKRVHVLVDETRPRLQGSRLTAWECEQYGIPYEIITDNAAGYFLSRGDVQKVFFGADRVAGNGDVINKVGTYMLSLAAHANNVPVVCVFPLSTLDPQTKTGKEVVIEERPAEEVLDIQIRGEQTSPKGAKVHNPAFDVTPHELISAWVTENGVFHQPFDLK